ncbi:hypothetical protein ABS71_11365 [bacterium SCN 62-11]|nr:MAG: hypothetical protein ABS71_11365 [bacterium SCN 62-11]
MPPPPVDRARRDGCDRLPGVPQNPPAGSLVIVDTFQDSWDKADHGNIGTYAAKEHGFRGKVFAENIGPDNPQYPRDFEARDLLRLGPQDPATTRQAVRDIARFRSADLLNDVSGDLNKLKGKGLHDSAVNVSYGVTPVRVADNIVQDVFNGTHPGSVNQNLSQNIFSAYKIDQSKLHSQDPKVAGPELKRLHDAVLQDTRAGFNHPEVKQAQKRYDQSVRDLQAQHNSVVVSAGNDQATPLLWKKESKGYATQTVASDFHNPLANSEVTTVGATRWTRGAGGLQEKLASYSNLDPTVDVYASGSVATGRDVNRKTVGGTSFSAPRVAGALATLHGNHPGASAGQMRNLMNNRLTHEVPGAGAPVLDFHAAEEYMRKGTF